MLAGPTMAIPVTQGFLKKTAYDAALSVLKTNWNNGLINRADVESYLRVIDEGNSPSRGTIVESAVRKAIVDFRSAVGGKVAFKGNQLGSLGGLDGFLKSIWKGVTGAIGSVVKAVTGGSGQVVVQPQVNIPPGTVQTEVTPEAAKAGVGEFLSNPVVLIAGGLLLLVLLKR